MVKPPKCKRCPHTVLMHRGGGTGKCRYGGCACEGSEGTVGGGYVSDLAKAAPVTRYTREEVQAAARAPVVRRGAESEPHRVGDVGEQLEAEFKRLTKTKRGGDK